MLLDAELLKQFSEWHLQRNNGEVSSQISAVLSIAASVTQKYYLPKAISADHFSEIEKYNVLTLQIERLQKYFNVSKTVLKSDKKGSSVSAQDLRLTAKQEFPDKTLLSNQSGTVLALNAGRALAIMLITNYPLRNINYREARLFKNIHKTTNGEWRLRFTGNDETASLKSKKRLHLTNIYERVVDLDMTILLEKYLNDWRPLLVRQIDKKISQLKDEKANSANQIEVLNRNKEYLFLNSKGIPFSRQSFSVWIERGIYRWLGVRISPEKIRQISVVEMFNKGKSLSQVAEELNALPASLTQKRKNLL